VPYFAFLQVPDLHVDPISQTLVERLGEGGQSQLMPLHVNALPLSFSFGVDKGKLIVDPSSDEEQWLSSGLTFCVNSEGMYSGTSQTLYLHAAVHV
jgi:exosome complex RNA-binding protein Rrp42 (RNase PH superfamily)